MLKPTVGIELLEIGSQTGRPEAVNLDLLYGKLSALVRIASAFLRAHRPWTLPQGLLGVMSCQHFANQSWLHPSPSP